MNNSCGHDERYTDTADEGTSYCVYCRALAAEKEIKRLQAKLDGRAATIRRLAAEVAELEYFITLSDKLYLDRLDEKSDEIERLNAIVDNPPTTADGERPATPGKLDYATWICEVLETPLGGRVLLADVLAARERIYERYEELIGTQGFAELSLQARAEWLQAELAANTAGEKP